MRSLVEIIDDAERQVRDVDVHQELVDAGILIDQAVAKMRAALLAHQLQGGTLDSITARGVELIMKSLVDNEYAATLKSNK